MEKIAIYGLSTETEKALPILTDKFTVVGLLDSFVFSGEMYGYPIIKLDNVKELGAEKIIVIARPGSCKAIARKIGDYCKANNIKLLDIRNNDLLRKKESEYDFKSLDYKYTKTQLINEIEKADVVSFDLFDTLITRRTLNSEDLLETLWDGEQLKNRLANEKKLSQGHSPKLEKIWGSIELANKEFNLDKKNVICRDSVYDLLKLAKAMGKKVCITTDTYYSKAQIEEILRELSILEYDFLLVSCEFDKLKKDGLFNVLVSLVETDNILHIGDDYVADITAAFEAGIKSFKIYSPEELFDSVSNFGIDEKTLNLCDRIKLGLAVSKVFNSPFVFESNERVSLNRVADIGFIIAAPLIADFIDWFVNKIRKLSIKNILLAARDGYLIKEIFDIYYSDLEAEYLLTSRTAAIRSGVGDAKDISYVMDMKFSGTIKDCMFIRFGLDMEDCDNDKILKSANEKRNNYRKYRDSLSLKNGETVFFDFVAKGTTQMFLQKIFSRKMKGLYFLQLEVESMKKFDIEVEAFYKEEERLNSKIYDNYYILETVLTAPHPSIDEFNDKGMPVYAKETRTNEELTVQSELREGVLEYIKQYYDLCDVNMRKENKMLDEKILDLINHVEIQNKSFLDMRIEDPFFNRMTAIRDVLG